MHLVGVLVRHYRHDLAHAQFRVVQPRVFVALAPYDLGEAAARLQRAADVAQRRARGHEEHCPEAGEGMVVGTAQVVLLDVGDEESRVRRPRCRGIPLAGEDEVRGAIDADRLAARADLARDRDRAVAEAAADVEDPLARPVGSPREELLAVARKALDEEVLEALELVEEHRVPGFHDDVVLLHALAPGSSPFQAQSCPKPGGRRAFARRLHVNPSPRDQGAWALISQM